MNKKIAQIKKILLNEWDPIGIRDIKEAHDEYDSYAEYIYKQKISNKNMSVCKYLTEIEKYIGLKQIKMEYPILWLFLQAPIFYFQSAKQGMEKFLNCKSTD